MISSESRQASNVDEFIRRYLRPDGVFLLRLIQVIFLKNLKSFQTNGGDLLVGEIISALYNRYRTRHEERNGNQQGLIDSDEIAKL